jgi:glycosidase
MQWDTTTQAGFTKAKPWLAVNENYKKLNVQEQETNPNSVLNYFRSMAALRKNNLVLTYGVFEIVDEKNEDIFAYTRELGNEQLLVVLNFSAKPAILNTTIETNKENILITNYVQPCQNNVYQPYAAVIYKLG